MGSRTVYFRECQCKRRSKLQKVKIALPQRLARRLEAQALEAGFDPEEYVIQVLEGKVGGVNGKEVTDPRTFTSLFSPSLSQTALMPQKSPQCLWMPTDTSRTRRLSRNLVDHTSWD